MNLQRLEHALKQIWEYGYDWKGKRQNNADDVKTKFVYGVRSVDELEKEIQQIPENLHNYARNRWYNFWSARGVEYMFSLHESVTPNKNQYDKLVDFQIGDITFDHKTTVFPEKFPKGYKDARENKVELIQWLYENQSQQGRKHLENRLFICLYDSREGKHWKMKAEIALLQDAIDAYMKNFHSNNLTQLDFGEGLVYSDIIWIEKEKLLGNV